MLNLSNGELPEKLPALPRKGLISGAAIASRLHVKHTRVAQMTLGRQERRCSSASIPTIRGAINEARVRRFSGGGPPLAGPITTSVSPDTISLTVPRNHPVAIAFQLDYDVYNLKVRSRDALCCTATKLGKFNTESQRERAR